MLHMMTPAYFLESEPAKRPVSIDEVKQHLNMDGGEGRDDALLHLMIHAATDYAEGYMGRTLVTTAFKVLLPGFYTPGLQGEGAIELRRSGFQAISRFEYFSGGVLTAVDPANYAVEQRPLFSILRPAAGACWPVPDDVPQPVEIVFSAGFGTQPHDVPAQIRMGILNHIAAFYADRGDCPCDAGQMAAFLPDHTRSAYAPYKLRHIGLR